MVVYITLALLHSICDLALSKIISEANSRRKEGRSSTSSKIPKGQSSVEIKIPNLDSYKGEDVDILRGSGLASQ